MTLPYSGTPILTPRSTVFISYSHHDKKWLDRLLIQIDPLTRTGRLDVWSDLRIEPGLEWPREIQRALEAAKTAVLLVSAHFLASRFIAENELPPLLEAAETGGLRIIWIAIGASLHTASPLHSYQPANDPAKPLNSLTRAAAEKELVRIAKLILDTVSSGRAEGATPARRDENGAAGNVEVRFSDIAERELGPLGAGRAEILRLLESEFRSHPILLRIDYESVPRPLSNGLCAVLSRSGGAITVERVERCFAPQDKFDLWSQMCAQYLAAYKLPFRTDHNKLLSRAEFARSLKALGSLLEALTKYVYETNLYHDDKIYPNLHRLKQRAEQNYMRAEMLYARQEEKDPAGPELGEVAMALDSVISCVHKIVLEYGVRG